MGDLVAGKVTLLMFRWSLSLLWWVKQLDRKVHHTKQARGGRGFMVPNAMSLSWWKGLDSKS